MLRIDATDDPRGFRSRLASGLAALVLTISCVAAWAGPQEEFEKASRAYLTGDVTGALKMVRGPADAGHAPAQSLLAALLESAGLFEESVAYYRKAAAQGDVDGQFGLASAFASGNGVERDEAEARRLFELAAGRGHVLAIQALAEVGMRGGLGVAQSPSPDAQYLVWIRKAAEQNYLPSLDYLARAYRSGSIGAVDLKLAQEYEARAEKLRYPDGPPRRRRNR